MILKFIVALFAMDTFSPIVKQTLQRSLM